MTDRPVKPAPPWYWMCDRELAFIVAHVQPDRGRPARAVAAWCALCALANQGRSSRVLARRSAVSRLSGLSGRAVVDGLADLEAVGLAERIGQPTKRGQWFQLKHPCVEDTGQPVR